MEQALVAGSLVGDGFLHQHVQVGPSGLPCRHGGHVIVVTASLKGPVQKLVDRQIAGVPAQALQKRFQACQLLPNGLHGLLRRVHAFPAIFLPVHKGTVHTPVLALFGRALVGRHHPGHLLVRHGNHGRFHHRGQRNVLHRIVHHGQKA